MQQPDLNSRKPARIGLLRRFGRDDRGATAVEFGIVSVPFLGLLFAIFQTAYLLLTQSAMDAFAASASRYIYTGQAQAGTAGLTPAALKTAVCGTTPAPSFTTFLNCSNIIVYSTTASSWGTAATDIGSSQSTYNSQAIAILNQTVASYPLTDTSHNICVGGKTGSGQIMILAAVYPVPAYLSPVAISGALNSIGANRSGQVVQTSTSNWVYPIMGTLAFQNEPFPNNSSYGGSC